MSEGLMHEIEDHETRLRVLERESATWRRLEALEARVRTMEITLARAVVVVGAVSFLASAIASGAVAFVFRSLG